MNNLNQLIIEGVVVGEPHYLEATHRLEFAIDTSRVYKNGNGEDVTEEDMKRIISAYLYS